MSLLHKFHLQNGFSHPIFPAVLPNWKMLGKIEVGGLAGGGLLLKKLAEQTLRGPVQLIVPNGGLISQRKPES